MARRALAEGRRLDDDLAEGKKLVAELNNEQLNMINDYGSCLLQKEVENANVAHGHAELIRSTAGSAASRLRCDA